MPKFDEVIKNKNFQKANVRPWNTSFDKTEIIAEQENKKPQYEETAIISVDPNLISLWEYKDRKYSSAEELLELANDLKNNKQQQSCIVRTGKQDLGHFELIIGERRWRAAKLAGINLDVVVKAYSDHEAAIAQATENENRKNLTDYERGMSYHKLIEKGIISREDLITKLNKSKQYISALLSFAKIPNEIAAAISDMSKVSAYTAEKIKQLAQRDARHVEALIKLASTIMAGKIGHSTIEKKVNTLISQSNRSAIFTESFYFKNGETAAKLKFEEGKDCKIAFSHRLNSFINNNKKEVQKMINEMITACEKEESG